MSLLSEAMEPFVIQNKLTAPDGFGGYYSQWTDGKTILAAAVLDTSTQAKIAAAQGVTDLYTITTAKAVTLGFHEVLKRVSDGAVFRVTSSDKKTPTSAGLDMRQVSAERWELT